MTIHPRVAQQPVCTDRLTLSRERIERLIEKADRVHSDDEWDAGFALGVAEVLCYLLNADRVSPALARTLGIGVR